MIQILRVLLPLCALFCALYTKAEIDIDGPAQFKVQVTDYLAVGKRSSKYLRMLIQTAKESPQLITIKPITDDPKTWHYSGKKSRSHTEAMDNKKRGAARNEPTASIIYINPNRIDKKHKSYRSGTLIHEFVHAVDLAIGKYNRDYKIREKRAIFFQNMWRRYHGKSLRSHYHERFETLEYQNARGLNQIKHFVDYYFENNDIP